MSWPPDFSHETPDERKARYEADGYVQVADNRWMKIYDAPRARTTGFALHDENAYEDGTFRYMTHGHNDKCDQPCIEDYADPVGRKEWPDYVVLKDGRQGPRPFRNAEERRSYERLTKMRRKDKNEVQPSLRAGRDKVIARVRELEDRLHVRREDRWKE